MFKHGKITDYLVYFVGLLLLSYVCFWLFDYNVNWTQVEIFTLIEPASLVNGAKLSKSFSSQIFDWVALDGYERVRFLSNLLNSINAKLRLSVSSLYPPHPSASLAWPMLILGAPVFTFFAMRNLTGKSTNAYAAAILLVCSSGVLSGVFMLFHMAKPVALFLSTIVFYLISVLVRRSAESAKLSFHDILVCLLLFINLILLFSSDEVGFLSGPALFCFLLHMVFSKRGLLACGTGIFAAVVFAAWTFWLAPSIVEYAGYGPFSMGEAAARLRPDSSLLGSLAGIRAMVPWNSYIISADFFLPLHAYVSYFFQPESAYLPWINTIVPSPIFWPFPVSAVNNSWWVYTLIAFGLMGSLAFLYLALSNNSPECRRLMWQGVIFYLFLCVGVTVLNQHFLINAHYYAGLVSIPAVIILASGLAFDNSRAKFVFSVLLFLFLGFVSVSNAVQSSLVWKTQGGYRVEEINRKSVEDVRRIWEGDTSLPWWYWANYHRETARARVQVRVVEEALLAAGSPDKRVRTSYIVSEPLIPEVRNAFLTGYIGSEIYDRKGDLKYLLRERCELCIRVSSSGVQWVELRSEAARSLTLPVMLASKVRPSTDAF